MKISSTGVAALPATPALAETTPPPAAAAAAPADALRGSALQSARSALNAMPEIDEAKVAAVRDALAKGEINFDPAKLASLISRYHGSKG